MIEAVSAVSFGHNNAKNTLFSRQQRAYDYHALEPLSSDDVVKEKKHTALAVTVGGIVIATGLYALLGKVHANGALKEIKEPSTTGEHVKSWLHKIGENAHSVGKKIKGWFTKK